MFPQLDWLRDVSGKMICE